MLGRRIKLFKLFGFEVKIDLSWIIIAILITWSLAIGFFPFRYRNLPIQTYWTMGVIGAIGFFLSVIFHEIFHSLVARRFGIPMKGITLFIFGGVSEMGEEPPSAKSEFLVAMVGPLSSIAIALACYGIHLLGLGRWPISIDGVVLYLAYINSLLAAFNLLPAFPLDGGRMLRAALWALKKNLRWATRIASRIGSGFAFLLMSLGVFQFFFTGNLIGGIWSFLIGVFLQGAARTSYQQVLIRRALEGEQVRRFMKTDPLTVPPSASLRQLVEDYIYKYHFKMFPVTEGPDKLIGCVTTKQLEGVSREEWDLKTVRDVATQCSLENTIEPQADAMKALSLMAQTGSSRLIVIDGNRMVGVVTLKDMLKFLSLKLELGQ